MGPQWYCHQGRDDVNLWPAPAGDNMLNLTACELKLRLLLPTQTQAHSITSRYPGDQGPGIPSVNHHGTSPIGEKNTDLPRVISSLPEAQHIMASCSASRRFREATEPGLRALVAY